MRRASLGLVLSTALVCGCATTDLGVRAAGEQARAGSTEANIRAELDEFETDLKTSGARVRDARLEAYVRDLGCSIVGDFCDELRFYVIEEPSFNAFMAPNGMMVLHSGLLLRLENEAQLAFVIAHEFGHYYENHGAEAFAAAKNANRAILATGWLGLIFGGLGILAFSREQEREADAHAVKFGAALGYDPLAGMAAWENLKAEIEASSNPKTRKTLTESSLFRTHPLTDERIAFLRAAPGVANPRGLDAAAYRDAVRPFLSRWLQAEIAQRDPGATLTLLDRLAASGADLGAILYARGEVLRLRDGAGDQEAALAAFEAAAGHADAAPATWRQIGVLERKLKRPQAARDAFTRYLALSPDAGDRGLIEMELATLEGTAP